MTEVNNGPDEQTPRTSGLAKASMVLGAIALTALVSGFWTSDMHLICAIAAMIVGPAALIQIKIRRGRLEGRAFALTGIIAAAAALALYAILLPDRHYRTYQLARRIICAENMNVLTTAIQTYSSENDGRYPLPDKWCDLLEDQLNWAQRRFTCPADKIGHCSYALNPYAEPNSPVDTVLLFETKGGWNQAGGREILTTENHNREGCNVGFVDCTVRFVKTEELAQLKWKPDDDK